MEKAADGYWLRLSFPDGRQRVLIPVQTKIVAERAAKAIRAAVKEGASFQAVQRAAAALATSQNAFDEALRQTKAVALAKPKIPKKLAGPTFAQVAKDWTDGTIAKNHPDAVKPNKRSVADDKQRVKHLNETIGDVPIVAFTREHAREAMANLPPTCKTAASRRHYAQVINRVINLAVEPLGIIAVSPLPRSWMPKVGKGKLAKSFLYPDEVAALLGCVEIPIHRRVTYMLCCFEGFRKSEALALAWSDLELTLGVVKLDKNKTDAPRAWALDATCAEALRRWRKLNPEAVTVVPTYGGRKQADILRLDLKRAGVTRSELAGGENRIAMRLHDLRGTFTTLALASGQTESWVQARTGHQSSEMIARYRQLARTAAEVNLGWFAPAYELLPELAALGTVQKSVQTAGKRGRRNS